MVPARAGAQHCGASGRGIARRASRTVRPPSRVLARDIEATGQALTDIAPSDIFDLERDCCWLPSLGLLSDAASRAGDATLADAVSEVLDPVRPLTIVDLGCLYRGSVAHASGLAAATCGRRAAAIELLSEAAAIHARQGSPWMARESEAALASVR